jgi:hypothetical protein
VVIRPRQAPFRSSTALVATVVPCTKRPTSLGGSPHSAAIRRSAAMTAMLGSLRVVGIFMMRAGALSWRTTTSVNVPPISTPMRRSAFIWFSHGYYSAFRSNRIVGWAKEPALAPATCPRVGTARKSAPLPTRKRSGFIGTCCNSKLSFARRKASARAHQCISTKRGRSLRVSVPGSLPRPRSKVPRGKCPALRAISSNRQWEKRPANSCLPQSFAVVF